MNERESEEKVMEIIADALAQKESITPEYEKKIREDIFNVLEQMDRVPCPKELADKFMGIYRYLKFKSFKVCNNKHNF